MHDASVKEGIGDSGEHPIGEPTGIQREDAVGESIGNESEPVREGTVSEDQVDCVSSEKEGAVDREEGRNHPGY